MNGLNLYIVVVAITVAILSTILNFTGRQKYKDNAGFFESANHELREQVTTLTNERVQLTNELTKAQTESTQKDEIIKQLKPFSDLAKIVSNNHKEVLQTMTSNFAEVTKLLAGKLKSKNGG